MMKDKSIIKLNQRTGAAALEMLIALAVLVFTVSSVISVVFGSQSISVDTETNSEALLLAHNQLEVARAEARGSYGSIMSIASTEDIYSKELISFDITPCKKQLTSNVTWNSTPSRAQHVALTTFVTDIAGALAMGGDCDTEGPSGSWESPDSYNITDPIHSGSQGTDIDVIKRSDGRFAFLTTNKLPGEDTLWMIDVTDAQNPTLSDSYNSGDDLFAVDTITNYAFVTGASSDQFRVINTSDPTDLDLVLATNLPGASSAIGRSIYYYNNRVYVGTQYLPCPSCPASDNNELHIFNVSDPENPSWEASINVDRNVNDIMVRDGLAYLAIGPGGTNDILRIYDVNPASPNYLDEIGNFVAPGSEQGTALYLLGNKVYLGRQETPAARRDFYIIDISSSTNPVSLGSYRLDLNPNTEVVGVVVAGNLAFISTSDQNPANGGGPFIILNISNPASPSLVITCPFNYSEEASGLDYIDDLVFVSNRSNDALRIIYPAPVCN